MRSILLLICSMVVGYILGGCSRQNEIVTNEPKLVTPDEAEAVVIRAKYYQTTGPCIELGDDLLGMPIIDAFQVVEVLDGDFTAKSINVRARTELGGTYPKDMEEGKIYTLRLTPSEGTIKQLRENQTKGHTYLWMDGDEIEEQKSAK